jgi:hypothetical protein
VYDNGVLKELQEAVDKLCGTDPQTLADTDAMAALHRCLNRMEAAVTRATGAFDASGAWAATGSRGAAMWLSVNAGVPSPVARRRVRLARALRQLPVAEAAWLGGEVHEAHLAVLERASNPRTEDAMTRDEEVLVGHAQRLSFGMFCKVMDYWRQHADPDGTEADAEAEHQARRVDLSKTFRGSWVLDGQLDPVLGTIVANQLRSIEDELFEADWAEGRDRLGDGVQASRLRRTFAQRRADALVEMAIRAGTAPAHGKRPEPLFSVLVDYETLTGRICELSNGAVVTPGSLVPWLEQAWVERIVFYSPSRVIDVGVTRRLFAGATRRAVEVRDRQCYHRYCDRTAEDCQVDHIEPWSEGGPTTQANGRLACGFHNRRRHRRRGPPQRE